MSQGGKENLKRVYRHHDIDEYGFSFLSVKISGMWMTKLIFGKDTSCEVCFMSDVHCKTRRKRVIKRNWKKHRKFQYK